LLAERVAPESATPRAETSPDLVAAALARRDVVSGAIRLLESERAQGFTGRNDTFLHLSLLLERQRRESGNARRRRRINLLRRL